MDQNPLIGAVTFLFTDLEGSSRLWEQYPAAMPAALKRHDVILQEAVEANHGQVVKTTGDGLLAAFPTARDGLQAAIAAQNRLASEAWGETGPLRARMGLHSGDAEYRQGDYFGPALNRAARLMALASGGQVLLSRAAAGLVNDRLPADIALRDLGEHCLRDLSEPERVYQAVASGLPADFPPLRSLSAFPNNLPVQLTSFVGREDEIAEVRRLLGASTALSAPGSLSAVEGSAGASTAANSASTSLSAPGNASTGSARQTAGEGSARQMAVEGSARLLTLTGPGGSGKTRLSLQTAAGLLEAFPDGVWLVELAALTDPGLATQAAAGALGVRELQGQPLLDTLTDYLRYKNCLLILDNCEHLIDAVARLAGHLLKSCARLKILASSREALGIPGEVAYRVPSLPPPAAGSNQLEVVAASAAVQLFVERAQAALPSFTLTEQNAAAVAQIARRLDGIPLALELAAARVRVLTAAQIAARLNDRFRLLTGGSRTALPRQQTLRALIDWSWELLTPAEQILLRRVSVFAGGWSLEAAEAVVCDGASTTARGRADLSGASTPLSAPEVEQPGRQAESGGLSAVEGPARLDSLDLLDLLDQLVNKSLVLVDRIGGEARYRLLETIRQYGHERLMESGEAARMRDRHLDYFLEQAEEIFPRLFGPEMQAWRKWYQREFENYQVAFEWALDSDPLMALRLASSYIDGPRVASDSILVNWLKAAIERTDIMLDQPEGRSPEFLLARSRGIANLVTAVFGMGEMIEAQRLSVEAVRLAREINDLRSLARAEAMAGLAFAITGDGRQAETLANEALQITEQNGYLVEEMMALSPLIATAIYNTGDLQLARRLSLRALQLARRVGNPWMIGMQMLNFARAAGHAGDLDQARKQYQEAEDLFQKVEDGHFINVSRSEMAHLLRKTGYADEALDMYRATLDEWRRMGNRSAAAHELECMGFIAVTRGQAERAARLFGAAEALREACGVPMTPMERIEYDLAVESLKRLIDSATVQANWSEGWGMNVEAAVEYALVETL